MCNGASCVQVGTSQIQTTISLTVGKFYTINDVGGDVIRVDSLQPLGVSPIIILNGSFDTCNEACMTF